MPRIREYTAQVNPGTGLENPGRRAHVNDFATGDGTMGRGLVEVGETLYDVAQRQEVSDVQAKLAKARAEWTVHLQERAAAAPAGDPNFASKFNEEFGNYIATLGDGVETRAGRQAWERGAAELSAHFVEKAGLFQAASAGAKAKQDYLSLLDSNRNTLINDPTQFEIVLRATTDALGDPAGMYAKMPAADRERLSRETRGELALSAVQGIIRMNPEMARQQLSGARWDEYLDADKKARLLRDADIAIHAKELELARQERVREREEKKARDAVEDKFVAALVEGNLSTKEIVDSRLTPDDKIKWLGLVERSNKPDKIVTNPQLLIDFWTRIHLPDGDPRKVAEESEINAFFGQGLTAENVKMLRDEMRGKRSAEGDVEGQMKRGMVDAIKTSLTGSDPLLRIRDPKGDEQFQKFLVTFLGEYQRQRQAGKTPAQLLHPDSPDYLGKLAIPLRRSRAQMMQDLISENSTDVLGPGAAAAAVSTQYTSKEQVVEDHRKGLLTRDAASRILREKGWAQ